MCTEVRAVERLARDLGQPAGTGNSVHCGEHGFVTAPLGTVGATLRVRQHRCTDSTGYHLVLSRKAAQGRRSEPSGFVTPLFGRKT